MKAVPLFWCHWWAYLTQFCGKKRGGGEKKKRKENIPRVKALITTLSPAEEKRSGFSLRNVSDKVSLLQGLKAHFATSRLKTLEETLYLRRSGPKSSSNSSGTGWKTRQIEESITTNCSIFCVTSAPNIYFNLHHSNYFLFLWNRRLICSSWRARWALKLSSLGCTVVELIDPQKENEELVAQVLCRIDEKLPLVPPLMLRWPQPEDFISYHTYCRFQKHAQMQKKKSSGSRWTALFADSQLFKVGWALPPRRQTFSAAAARFSSPLSPPAPPHRSVPPCTNVGFGEKSTATSSRGGSNQQ